MYKGATHARKACVQLILDLSSPQKQAPSPWLIVEAAASGAGCGTRGAGCGTRRAGCGTSSVDGGAASHCTWCCSVVGGAALQAVWRAAPHGLCWVSQSVAGGAASQAERCGSVASMAMVCACECCVAILAAGVATPWSTTCCNGPGDPIFPDGPLGALTSVRRGSSGATAHDPGKSVERVGWPPTGGQGPSPPRSGTSTRCTPPTHPTHSLPSGAQACSTPLPPLRPFYPPLHALTHVNPPHTQPKSPATNAGGRRPIRRKRLQRPQMRGGRVADARWPLSPLGADRVVDRNAGSWIAKPRRGSECRVGADRIVDRNSGSRVRGGRVSRAEAGARARGDGIDAVWPHAVVWP